MNKNRHFFLTAILMAICFFTVAFTAIPEFPTQNSRPIACNFGFKVVATPTIDLVETDVIDLKDYLPSGTLGFELRAKSGDFVIGEKNSIASGTDRIGRLVSEGESYIWNNNAGTFLGSIIMNSGTGTVVIDAAWGHFEYEE